MSFSPTVLTLVLVALIFVCGFGMSNYLNSGNPFKRKEDFSTLKVGEIYTQNPDNPFLTKSDTVEILEIRNGWVKYKFGSGFVEHARTASSFKLVYKPVNSVIFR